MNNRRRRLARVISVVFVIGLPAGVRAQEPAQAASSEAAASSEPVVDSMTALEARRLFLEGRGLLDKGQAGEACVPLERSHKLVPTLGTLLNLGLCHRFAGHLSTAHDYYRAAEVMATLKRDAKRGEFAHNEAAELAPRRASLILRLTGDSDTLREVRLDDTLLPPDAWQQPRFIDAGEHRVSVVSSHDQRWQGTVLVVDGSKHVLVIPAFEASPVEALAPAPKSDEPPPPPMPALDGKGQVASTTLAGEDVGLSTPQVVGLSLGAAGIVALGASLVFTISAKTTYDDSNEMFCGSEAQCSPEGLRLRDEAFASATWATVLGISGGVALASGLVLWLWFPSEHSVPAAPIALGATRDSVVASWSTRL